MEDEVSEVKDNLEKFMSDKTGNFNDIFTFLKRSPLEINDLTAHNKTNLSDSSIPKREIKVSPGYTVTRPLRVRSDIPIVDFQSISYPTPTWCNNYIRFVIQHYQYYRNEELTEKLINVVWKRHITHTTVGNVTTISPDDPILGEEYAAMFFTKEVDGGYKYQFIQSGSLNGLIVKLSKYDLYEYELISVETHDINHTLSEQLISETAEALRSVK